MSKMRQNQSAITCALKMQRILVICLLTISANRIEVISQRSCFILEFMMTDTKPLLRLHS